MNLFVRYVPGEGYVTYVFPRAKHRPDVYYATGAGQRLVSPGAIDMAGLVITPRECDFRSIEADEVLAILREVALPQEEMENVVRKLSGKV